MQATVWGGAGEHGRSCYLIEHSQTRILLDCGVKKEEEGIYPEYRENIVRQLDAVFLSHAHEDHSMALPMLYQMGYTGKVWTTRATWGQLPAYFTAWKQYAASQGVKLPYEDSCIQAIQYEFIEEAIGAGEWFEISSKLSVCWGRSGHLAGSIWLLFNMEGSLVFYSGDYTAESSLLAVDEPNLPDRSRQSSIELAIVEAAYGVDNDNQEQKLRQLRMQMEEALEEEALVLLPVPTYGRGQDLLVWVREIFPEAVIIVEEEIMTALKQLLQESEWLREDAVRRLQSLVNDQRVTVVKDVAQREWVMANTPSGIVFTNDGMMQSAKCQRYYELLKKRENYAVILTGHLAKGSFGEQLLQAEQVAERPRVHKVRYKVHQGLPDVKKMLSTLHSKHVLLVHAGKRSTDALQAILSCEGYSILHSLTAGDTIEI